MVTRLTGKKAEGKMDNAGLDRVRQAEQIIAALETHLLPRRIARMKEVLSTRSDRVAFVFERMVDPHNLSAVLRTMDAFSFQEAHLIAPLDKLGLSKGITSGAERWLTLNQHEDTVTCLKIIRSQGFQIIASHVAPGRGITLAEIDFSRPVALVFGNEHAGVGEEVLALADQTFHVPMRGMVESFNLSVAAAICAAHARQALETNEPMAPSPEGFLLPREKALAIYALWLQCSVRRSEKILIEQGIAPMG